MLAKRMILLCLELNQTNNLLRHSIRPFLEARRGRTRTTPKRTRPVRGSIEAGRTEWDEFEGKPKKRSKEKKETEKREEQADEFFKSFYEKVEKKYGKEEADNFREKVKKMVSTQEGMQEFTKLRQIFAKVLMATAGVLGAIFFYFYLQMRKYNTHLPVDPYSGRRVQPTQIGWNDFLTRIVPTGQVSKVLVFVSADDSKNDLNNQQEGTPKRSHILAIINRGAKGTDGSQLDRAYTIQVPDIRRMENEIRAAEVAAGVPPHHWANFEWEKIGFGGYIFLLAIIIPSFLAFLLFKKTSKFMGGTFGGFGDTLSQMMGHKLRILDPRDKASKLKIKFRDVAGLHEAKVEINEFVDYLRRPAKYTVLGARLPKGALLTGPPGCGKTLLAKALAAESSVPFINVNGTEFVEMIGGLGASRVRQLFKEAKSRAPCIIYMDEIDAIGRKREDGPGMGGGGNSELEQTLNQLLVEMDGMDSGKGIVVIASTNRPDILDKALMRPGRLDRHISVDLPTLAERKEMFELYLRKVKRENRLTGMSQRLAQMTPGFSGADIANVVNEAAIHAATNQKKWVAVEDIDYALEKIIAGPEKRSRTLVKEEREVVAFHESGHALVGWLLEHTEALLKVTIIPRTSAALGFAQYSPKDRKLFTKEELFDRMCMMLGGRAAENVAFGRITTGAQNDLDKVTKQANAMVKWYGMSETLGPISFMPGPGVDPRSVEFMEKPYSKRLGNIIDQEVSKLVADAYFYTENLMKENRDKLETLAHALLKRETLNYEDVKKLIGPPRFGDKNVVDLPEDVLPDPRRPE